jgi:hypothetical protein
MNVSNFFLRNFEEDDIFILSVIKFVHLYIKKKKKKKKKSNFNKSDGRLNNRLGERDALLSSDLSFIIFLRKSCHVAFWH